MKPSTLLITAIMISAGLSLHKNAQAEPMLKIPGSPFHVEMYGFDAEMDHQSFKATTPSENLSADQIKCGKRQYAELGKALAGEPLHKFFGASTLVQLDVTDFGQQNIDEGILYASDLHPSIAVIAKDHIYIRSVSYKSYRESTRRECLLVYASEIRTQFEGVSGVATENTANADDAEKARTRIAVQKINQALNESDSNR